MTTRRSSTSRRPDLVSDRSASARGAAKARHGQERSRRKAIATHPFESTLSKRRSRPGYRRSMTMAMKDLVPWSRGRDVSVRRSEELSPFFTLHREMNRLFDDVFRGFDLTPFDSERFFDRGLGWPSVE